MKNLRMNIVKYYKLKFQMIKQNRYFNKFLLKKKRLHIMKKPKKNLVKYLIKHKIQNSQQVKAKSKKMFLRILFQ